MSGQQAGTLLTFGIDASSTLSYGLVQGVEQNDKVQRATAIAPDGNIVSIQEYGSKSGLSLTYLPLDGTSDGPEIGDPFIYAGSTWQVDDIMDGQSPDGFNVKTVAASNYPSIH